MPTSPTAINELLSTIRRLPPLPGGVARLMALSPSSTSFFETAAAIIKADQALAAQVLKLANSALFAGQAPVNSVDRAILRVGARMISSTLTEGHLRNTFDTRDDAIGHLWLANVFAANLAMFLVRKNPALAIEPEVAYTYGLLHDVGRLVLVALYRDATNDLIEENPHPGTALCDREEEHLGVSHVLAGRLLGNRWKLPTDVTVIVAGHHLPAATRRQYPPALNAAIDLMTLVDSVVHHVIGEQGDIIAVETSLDELLVRGGPAVPLDALGFTPEDVVGTLRPAMAAVERQKRLLGLTVATPFGAILS